MKIATPTMRDVIELDELVAETRGLFQVLMTMGRVKDCRDVDPEAIGYCGVRLELIYHRLRDVRNTLAPEDKITSVAAE